MAVWACWRWGPFLLVAPVIESGTSTHMQVFQAVGDACDGGGGGW